MPFDFAPSSLSGNTLLPIDAGTIHGVPRHELVAHAMEQLAPALRGQVAEIELSAGGQFFHMGMVFDQVAWRVVWRRPGLPVASGNFPVWNGALV
ncbi:hypothetical protein [Falsiroseomonas ponticola]|uniref:hypothetical protein n=1 Tax=Falsiroseomonas ponticola TaxID=2786951 RepID=UPI0019335EF1|nr:hypothetical protein [Roseomonas ponticola]